MGNFVEPAISNTWLYKVTKQSFPEGIFERLHPEYNTNALRTGPIELLTDTSLVAPHAQQFVLHAGVYKLEPFVHEKMAMLKKKLYRLCESALIQTYEAFRLFTTEIIMEFAFARSAEPIEQSPNDFRSWFLNRSDVAFQGIGDMQYRPWLRHLSGPIPESLLWIIRPEIGKLLDLLQFAEASLRYFQKRSKMPSHPVVFESLGGITVDQKVTEGMDILIAGADTTVPTLTTGFLHILKNPEIRRKLLESRRQAFPSATEQPSLRQVEKTACVKESFRLGITVISMSAYSMHTSTEAWEPDARGFYLPLWLRPNKKSLVQYLCTFSKGSRICLVSLWLKFACAGLCLSQDLGYEDPPRSDPFTLAYLEPGVLLKMTKCL
ncbi:cytochrome P450 [Aspergillus pseudodeflectus]|uniref:Cytochrome P450 n=1 Tax=Aspergillus pseudodeflectus TaxID=176178 RepID=A0ABR4L4H0_9EURO